MGVVIKNLRDRPLWVTLTSGRSIRVSAKQETASLDLSEVEGNRLIENLERQRIIELRKKLSQIDDERAIDSKTTKAHTKRQARKSKSHRGPTK